MIYSRQNFDEGEVLEAKHLNKMEDAIASLAGDSRFTDEECRAAFFAEADAFCKRIGATSSTWGDPTGYYSVYSTAKDLALIMLHASGYEKLYDIWNTPTWISKALLADGTVRNITCNSTIFTDAASDKLTAKYRILGTKTGTLSNRKNLVSIAQSKANPENVYIVSMFGANDGNGGAQDRFGATLEVLDYVESIRDTEPAHSPLDDIAYENLTYRDIFITNNYAPNINENSFYSERSGVFASYSSTSGTLSIVSDTTTTSNFLQPYTVKVDGTTSQQYRSKSCPAGDYLLAANIKVDRYVRGGCGICTDGNITACTVSRVTTGYETIVTEATTSATPVYIGSVSSANLTGYINNPVMVSKTLFSTPPTVAQFTQLYKTFEAKFTEALALKVILPSADCFYVLEFPKYNGRAYQYLKPQVLFAQNENKITYPASTTKLMVAALAAEWCPDFHERIYVKQGDYDYYKTYGSTTPLEKPGDTIQIKDLLYDMLLPSSDQAPAILARVIGEKILRAKSLYDTVTED